MKFTPNYIIKSVSLLIIAAGFIVLAGWIFHISLFRRDSHYVILIVQAFIFLFLLIALFVLLKNNRQIKREEEMHRKYARETPDYKYALNESCIVAITDQEGIIIHVNDNFCKISKYEKDELIGQNHRIVNSGFHPKEFFGNLWSTISNGTIWRGEVRNLAKDGSVYWEDATIVPFLNEQGIPIRYLSIRTDITERKKADVLRQESEENYRQIVETTQEGVWMISKEGKTSFVNERMAKMLGYERKEMAGKPLFEFMDEEGVVLAKYNLQRREQGIAEDHEFKFIRKDRSEIWAILSTSPVEKNGKYAGALAMVTDITERKKAEKLLSASKQRYKNLLENINDGFMVDDISAKIIFANKKFLEIFGFSESDLNHLFPENYVAPGYLDLIKDRHNRRMSGENVPDVFEFEGLRKDGKRVWIETHVNPIVENGIFTGTQSIMRDFTERKRVEEEKYLLQDILQKSLNEIYIFDPESLLFHYINSGALRNLGYGESEIKKLTPLDLKPAFTRQTFKELMAPLVNGGPEKIVFFTDHKRKDGSLYPVEVHLQLVRRAEKKYFLAIILDITERKKIEKELAEQKLKQQKLLTEITIQAQERERNTLGRELHDNINQILATIKMYLGMARSGNGTQVELIDKSHAYVNEVMKEIRNLSHSLVTPSLGDIGLKEALEELTKDTNLMKDLKIELMVDKNYNENGWDENKKLMFYRIVQEQLNNIIKYAGATEVVLRFRTDNGKLFLSIADNGVGFDTAQKGYGIGLKNISSRAEFYGGQMNIITAPGKGCTLEVSIPY